MTGPLISSLVTRRLFIEKSVKGTAALVLSHLLVFDVRKIAGADRSLRFLNLPSPQFPVWTPDGKLIVTFIAEDGSYGLWQNKRAVKSVDDYISVGTAIGQFNWPQGIAVDKSIAYIVDSNNGRIQRLDLETWSFLDPFGGLGKKSGLFLRPQGICSFNDELFIADTRNHRIQVFSNQGKVKRIIGELGDADEQFRLPTSCAVSPQGEVFAVDSKHALIKVFDLEGRFLRKFGGLSSLHRESGLLNMPAGIALDGKRGLIYIADTGNSRVQAFDYSGKFIRLVESPGMTFKTPKGIALLDSGDMAISDPQANTVWMTTV
jgi:DNA-binding beta-propeller fold protein YncE